MMTPLFIILMVRPSLLQISAICTTLSGMFGVLGYYSESSIQPNQRLWRLCYNALLLLMASIFEFTNRTSFVNQLSATRYAEARFRLAYLLQSTS